MTSDYYVCDVLVQIAILGASVFDNLRPRVEKQESLNNSGIKSIHMIRTMTILAVGSALILPAVAEDWTQWRGPNRADISNETGLLKTWGEAGPDKLWVSQDVGMGYSGISVADGKIFTMGSLDGQANLIALSEKDGSKIWSTPIGQRLENGWGGGPRATPTVDGDHVYAMSGPGDLICARVDDGKEVWRASMKELGGRVPNWGYCESVLVDGEQAVCTPGGQKGAMVAFNKKTGEKLWQSEGFTQGAQYSSIIVAEHNGKRQYIQLTQKELVGIDSTNGKVIWSSPWQGRTAVIPTPIFHDGHVYIASGYGVGCKLVKLNADNTATDVYVNKVMKNHHGGVIKYGDHLYGYSDSVQVGFARTL